MTKLEKVDPAGTPTRPTKEAASSRGGYLVVIIVTLFLVLLPLARPLFLPLLARVGAGALLRRRGLERAGLVEEESAHRRGDREEHRGEEARDQPGDDLAHDALEAHVHQREVRERQAPLEVPSHDQDAAVSEHGGVAAPERRFGDDALAGGKPGRRNRPHQ